MSGKRPGSSIRRRKNVCNLIPTMVLAILMLVPAGLTGSRTDNASFGGRAAPRSSPEPPVSWVQDSPEAFNGSGDNLSQPVDVVVDEKGLSLAEDHFQIIQTDWSGGPKAGSQSTGGRYFNASGGIKWSDPGHLSLLYDPTWTELSPLLTARSGSKAVWDDWNDQVIVFGGWSYIGYPLPLLNNTEYYNTSTDTWSNGTSTPPGRRSPSTAWDSRTGQMFIFGGNDGSVGEFNDAWLLTPGKGGGGTWTQVSSCPEAMENGNAIYDPNTDLLVAHGRSYMSVSRYDLTNDSWSQGSDEYHIRDYAGGAWLPDQGLFMIVNGDDYSNKPETGFYAPGNDSWILGPDYPPWRRYPTLVWDDILKVGILYGGTTNGGTAGATNEIWIYDLKNGNWSLLDDQSGPKVYGHTSVWDPVNSQMLVIGGMTSDSWMNGSVYSMKLCYCATSWLDSSTFDTGGIATITGVDWDMDSLPSGVGSAPVKLQLASSPSSTPSKYVGPDGSASSYYAASGPNSSESHAGDRYLRYRLTMSTADTDVTPVLGRISINYSRYRSSGSFNSTVFDTGLESPMGLRVDWTAETPHDTTLDIYIRSGADAGMASAGGWIKVQNGQDLGGTGLGRYIQYRVEMGSPSHGFTPLLRAISFGFNGAPSLALAGHAPFLGNLTTAFTFYVTYTDPDGTPPALASLVLDGVSIPISAPAAADVRKGLRYECSTRLSAGAHRYYFLFNDGFVDARLPAAGDIEGPTVNADPALSEGAVDPPDGNLSTVFTFTVRYSDPERALPAYALLVIDGTQNLTMETGDAAAQDSLLYDWNMTLTAGTHGFCFRFSDGVTEVRLPPDGESTGPVVLGPSTPPGLLAVYPADSSRDVPVNVSVEATFDHPMDAGSFSAQNFSLKSAHGHYVGGIIFLDADLTKAVLRPAANLGQNETYTARLTTEIRDKNGTALLSEQSWSFTTVHAAGPVNRAPAVAPRFEKTVTEGQALVLDLQAVDPDGDALSYTVFSGPKAAQVSGSGILTWKTARGDSGRYEIVVEVSDGKLSSQTSVNVTVLKAAGGGGAGGGSTDYIAAAVGMIVVVAVAVAVAIFVMKKRKGTGEPGNPR